MTTQSFDSRAWMALIHPERHRAAADDHRMLELTRMPFDVPSSRGQRAAADELGEHDRHPEVGDHRQLEGAAPAGKREDRKRRRRHRAGGDDP